MFVALSSFGSEPAPRSNITISGWGYVQEDSLRFSKKLQVASVSVVDRDRCNAIYDGEITVNMICAETRPGNPAADACQVCFLILNTFLLQHFNFRETVADRQSTITVN